MIHVDEIAPALIDLAGEPDDRKRALHDALGDNGGRSEATVTATPATLLRGSRRMAEHFDEIAAKGSTRLQQTVAASLAAELRVEGNRARATAWRH